MPMYEYVCPLCQKVLKETRSIHEDSPTHLCDNCNVEMHQIIGSIGVSFKGGGWGHSPS